MAQRRLAEDERVAVFTRSHWKALVLPALVLVGTCAVAGFLAAAALTKVGQGLAWVVLAVAALAVCYFSVRPFLRWLSTSYTVTNRRIIIRSGVLRRSGRDIPLHRITDVTFTRGLLDRLLGSGTMVVCDASDSGRALLADVPRVRALQLALGDLMYDGRSDWEWTSDARTDAPYLPADVHRR